MKKYSLERLVDLARKTGGKLIVHNEFSEDEDVVILSVEEFEKMADGKSAERDVRDLSSDEMLDQINRDIAVWRANQEQEEEWEKTMALDEETEDEELFSPPSAHNYHTADWHSVSDVINKKYTPKLETVEEEIKIENVPFKPMGVDANWQEEPLLSDEPVFYEEPV